MVRNYVRKAGSRNYKTQYSNESLHNALENVRAGARVKSVSQKYNIPRSTLTNKLTNLHSKKSGGQKRLLDNVENMIFEIINQLAVYRVPVDSFDIRSWLNRT